MNQAHLIPALRAGRFRRIEPHRRREVQRPDTCIHEHFHTRFPGFIIPLDRLPTRFVGQPGRGILIGRLASMESSLIGICEVGPSFCRRSRTKIKSLHDFILVPYAITALFGVVPRIEPWFMMTVATISSAPSLSKSPMAKSSSCPLTSRVCHISASPRPSHARPVIWPL